MFRDQNAVAAVEEYESILRHYFADSPPCFDLVFLGFGVDGHTASLFSDDSKWNETQQWVSGVQKSTEDFPRMTLTLPLLNQTKMALFLVAGNKKADALQRALKPIGGKAMLPANQIRPSSGQLNWFVDAFAFPSQDDTRYIEIASSILAADFAHLADQVDEVTRSGAHRLHVDVMDGHFVPNLSIGTPIIRSLRKVTDLMLDTHLMITDPDSFLETFAECGSDSLIVHLEGNHNLHRTVQKIRNLGKQVGVVINPATPACALEEILEDLDQVLVMTVDPGFGHQTFIPSTLPKIRLVRSIIERINPLCELAVDGGING